MKFKTTPILAILLIFTACVQNPPKPVAPNPKPDMQVTDSLGRVVTFDQLPQRIVITGKGLFMLADAAYLFPEASERIVGLGNAGQGNRNFVQMIDPAFSDKTILENDAGADQIAALQPDLVLLKSYLAETIGAPIEALGIPVVYVDFETPEQYARDLAILGVIFGDETLAAEIASAYEDKMTFILNVVQDAYKPSTLLLYYTEKDGNVAFNVPPKGWIQTRMVEMAGGDPVWMDANPGSGWTQVSLEQIAAWNAEEIFIVSYTENSSDVVSMLLEDPNWQVLRAAQENGLHAFPGDYYSWDQPDPRWILGLSWLAGRLHPELFPNLNMIEAARDFFQTNYRLDAAAFDQVLLPNLRGDLP